jgi:extracellular solute-binding protein (family 5)
VPDLAEFWTIAPDGMTYTLKLRQGVRFHDGSPMTSRDIKASYDKIIFPANGEQILDLVAFQRRVGPHLGTRRWCWACIARACCTCSGDIEGPVVRKPTPPPSPCTPGVRGCWSDWGGAPAW